jgi:adenine-specific DNA-methyltransferase
MPTLQFKGKSFVENHHLTVPYHQLLPDEAASLTAKVSLSDNLIIQGDNLIALKALLPNYQRRVKCIYIDPPYNTGEEGWKYNDNVNSPMIQEWLRENKAIDKDDLTRHDKWLCMMMPRLTLLRELLRDDGVIFVSIDDNEAHHLRMLMDEIFGADNFIAQLVWEKGRKNDARLFSVGHEYILVYARSLQALKALKTIWREPKPGAKEVWEHYITLRDKLKEDDRAIEQELKQWYSSLPKTNSAKALSRYWRVDANGPWRDRDISWPGGGGPRYKVIHPITKQPVAIPERGWGFATPGEMQRQIDLGLIEFREDQTKPPFRKAHLRPVVEELDQSDGLFEDDENISEEEVGMQVMPSVIYKQS